MRGPSAPPRLRANPVADCVDCHRHVCLNRRALHKAPSEDGKRTLETALKVRKAPGPHMRIEEAGAQGA